MDDWLKNGAKKLEIIDEREIDTKARETWGNSGVKIGEKEIEALRSGRVLFHNDGEYGTFVFYENEPSTG